MLELLALSVLSSHHKDARHQLWPYSELGSNLRSRVRAVHVCAVSYIRRIARPIDGNKITMIFDGHFDISSVILIINDNWYLLSLAAK